MKLLVLGLLLGSILLFGCLNSSTEAQTGKTVNEQITTPAQPTVNESVAPSEVSTAPAVSAASDITLSELAKHNSESDCWVGFRGSAYDVTSFLPKHPGSAQAILPYCGSTDFEQAFLDKHGEGKVSAMMSVTVLKGKLA